MVLTIGASTFTKLLYSFIVGASPIIIKTFAFIVEVFVFMILVIVIMIVVSALTNGALASIVLAIAMIL